MLHGKSKALKENHPVASAKKRSVVISLSESGYQRAHIAAKSTDQAVAAWIADMVYMSTQP